MRRSRRRSIVITDPSSQTQALDDLRRDSAGELAKNIGLRTTPL
ncbi:hypothetical protein [Ensifer sp. ENS04]|nr:hypothetical protein [Ensifer sp. ENS04]